jgi:antitoxin YefM
VENYTSSQAREKLYNLIDQVAQSHEPIYITGKRNNAVMISEEDYSAIQETLYLLSVPGMRESIVKARKEPKSKCKDKLDW